MTDDERKLLLTVIETVESSLNVLEKKAEAFEKVLGKAHPALLEEYEKLWRTAATNSPSSSAQMLRETRRKILKSMN